MFQIPVTMLSADVTVANAPLPILAALAVINFCRNTGAFGDILVIPFMLAGNAVFDLEKALANNLLAMVPTLSPTAVLPKSRCKRCLKGIFRLSNVPCKLTFSDVIMSQHTLMDAFGLFLQK